jgi:hypothetical protein
MTRDNLMTSSYSGNCREVAGISRSVSTALLATLPNSSALVFFHR